MAEREIRLAHSTLKAGVWKHFGFYEVEGKKDTEKSHTICKLWQTKQKYFENTTIMRNHTMFPPGGRTIAGFSCCQPNDHRTNDYKASTQLGKGEANYKLYRKLYCQGFDSKPGLSHYVAHFSAKIQCPILKIFYRHSNSHTLQ